MDIYAMTAILGPNDSHLETLISHLMSSSNDERSEAESLFNVCKQIDPGLLACSLSHLLQVSPKTKIRDMCAVLLRKLLTRGDSYIWPRISPVRRSLIGLNLLCCVRDEKDKSVKKKICYTISEFACGIIPENEWPLFFQFVFQCLSSDSPSLQESAFLILSELSQYSGEILVPFIEELDVLFRYDLPNSSNPEVRVAALIAAINFIKLIACCDEMDRVQDLLPYIMNTLKESLNLGGQEAAVQEALELLIEFADAEPRFLTRQQLADFAGSVLEIAKAKFVEEGTRNLKLLVEGLKLLVGGLVSVSNEESK